MGKIDFSGKTVLVTGASTGIGKALAYEFASRGANMALGALPQEQSQLNDVAKNLEEAFNIRTWCFPVDLAEPDGPDKLFQAVKREAGVVDILVNNAGTAIYGKFWEQPRAGLQKMVELNLNAPLQLMHLFLPDMIGRKKGTIFNISSVSALQPTPFQTVYGATKAGLQSLSQALRTELKGTGVTVCTLNPPYVDTAILGKGGFPNHLRWYAISGLKKPDWIARKAIKAFEKQKFLHVPGLRNWLVHILLMRLSPRRTVDWMSRFFLQGKKKSM